MRAYYEQQGQTNIFQQKLKTSATNKKHNDVSANTVVATTLVNRLFFTSDATKPETKEKESIVAKTFKSSSPNKPSSKQSPLGTPTTKPTSMNKTIMSFNTIANQENSKAGPTSVLALEQKLEELKQENKKLENKALKELAEEYKIMSKQAQFIQDSDMVERTIKSRQFTITDSEEKLKGLESKLSELVSHRRPVMNSEQRLMEIDQSIENTISTTMSRLGDMRSLIPQLMQEVSRNAGIGRSVSRQPQILAMGRVSRQESDDAWEAEISRSSGEEQSNSDDSNIWEDSLSSSREGLTDEEFGEIPLIVMRQGAPRAVCMICRNRLKTGENVRKPHCNHMFHSSCLLSHTLIHDTCYVCRCRLI